MDRHLVAVEVGVERRADERMDLDRLAFDEHRLERLDAEPVERRRAVEEHRMILDDLFENVPHLGALASRRASSRSSRSGRTPSPRACWMMNGLKSSSAIDLRQPALVNLELGADDDDRAARVVDALAEEVLAEPSLLALEHVAQALERPVALAADRAGAAAVVEQRVDRFLEHALLVAEDDLGRPDLDELLEAVVAVDDAAVEVVQVARRETSALERHERPEIGRKNRDDVEDHPLGLVLALPERFDDLEALQNVLLALNRRLDLRLGAEIDRELLDVDRLEQVADRLAAHLGDCEGSPARKRGCSKEHSTDLAGITDQPSDENL